MSSLYHYYPSKQALLVSIMDQTMADLIAGGTAAVDSGHSSRAKLIAGIRHHVLFQAERRKENLITDTEIRALEPDNQTRNVEMRDRYEQLFIDVLREGFECGQFSSFGDLKVSVAGLFAMLNGVAAWYRPEGRRTLDEIADQYCEIFLNGIATRRVGVVPSGSES
jgi:TetR/AcrR family transcriptional regulator, cholesterol catabolism regulator